MTHEPSLVVGLEHPVVGTPAEQVAHLLRQLRRRQARQCGGPELTYRELAARTGWSIGTFAGYFNGQVMPPTDRFDMLVTLLGATPVERGALATARDRAQESRRRSKATTDSPVPRQLPLVGFPFAGRTRELAGLDALLRRQTADVGPESVRVVPAGTVAVVCGGAGVGKTSLAVHWAHRVAGHFPDGQIFVNLRGFDPGRPPVSPAEARLDLLDALGVSARAVPRSGAAQEGLYRSLVAGRRMLIVLDDARDADQIRPLLPGTSSCLTVVTSRSQMTGLAAVEGAHHIELDVLSLAEARDLLARRLGSVRVAAELETVDELIRCCAALPLALAVVAARAGTRPTFPLAALAEELRNARDTLDPFATEDPTADPRAAFAGSYRQLRPPAAKLFRWIGGHPGPDLTAEAAASIAGVPPAAVRPALAELTRARLVVERVPGRYAMHDLLRVFASEQTRLVDGPKRRRAVVRRILDHYLRTAYTAAMLLYPAGDPIALVPSAPGVTCEGLSDRDHARRWLENEHRVLVGAVGLAAVHGFAAHAWQLAWALTTYLDWRGHWQDLVAVQGIALMAATQAGNEVGRIHALRFLARAGNRLGRYADAHAQLEEAIDLCRRIGDRAGEAHCHLNLSLTLELSGRYEAALEHAHTALNLFHVAGHRPGYASSLGVVGWYHALLGRYERALDCCRQAVKLQTELGSPHESPATLDSLGYTYHQLGRCAEAAVTYQRAVTLYRESGDRYHEADTLVHLGDCHQLAGDGEAALVAWRQALNIFDDLRHPAAAGLRALPLSWAGLTPTTDMVADTCGPVAPLTGRRARFDAGYGLGAPEAGWAPRRSG
ncbi:tetratricopeptide repeat protein [Micromonospora sp. KC723]|uniref:tetratricopeptide repeat protein n=1 Tax=Micromonospora sp. KC723 TaxID=2530381 RepID=UPI001051F8B1|nr:tetratricopeptide repeat protein [Micromonospora sp. KC723]TDB76189.1 tetratricopeptide repeat protein [Micromonospora sp. KC723]